MITKIIISISLTILISGITSCGNTSNNNSDHNEHEVQEESEHSEAVPADEHSGHNHAPGSPDAIREGLPENQVLLTARQMKSVDIDLGHVSKENLSDVVKAFGNVVLPPAYEASVSAFIDGVVKNIEVMEGDFVSKGAVLAGIEHPDVAELQRDYLEAVNIDKYLKSEYERQKRLLRDSVNAVRIVQKLESDFENNRTRLQSLKRKLEMIHLDPEKVDADNLKSSYPLIAPVSGIVAEVLVNTGVPVSSQKELFHIADNDKVHLDLQVYEKDIVKIGKGQKLTFNLSNSSSSSVLSGVVLKKSGRFDTTSRTALVHAEINEKSDVLMPGMAVTAYIQTGANDVHALPSEAFASDQGKNYVFRLLGNGKKETEEPHAHSVEPDDHSEESHDHEEDHHSDYYIFERVEVTKGMSEGGLTEVIFSDTLRHEARYVVNNAAALLSEIKSGGGDHHNHAH